MSDKLTNSLACSDQGEGTHPEAFWFAFHYLKGIGLSKTVHWLGGCLLKLFGTSFNIALHSHYQNDSLNFLQSQGLYKYSSRQL